ncbi:hypothetical protein Bca101_085112 [Brassica carinata]
MAQPNPNPLLRQAQETRRDKRELIEKQVRNREQENQSGIDDRSLNRKLNLDEPATELEHQPACVLKPTTRRRDNRIHWHTPREGRNSYSTSENQGTTLQTDDSMDRKQRTTDNPGEATSFHPHANAESQTRSKGKTILNFSPKADCQAPLQWSTLRRQILTHDVEHIRGEIGDDTAAKRESENSKGDPPDAGTRRHAPSGPEVSKHKVDASGERRGRDKEEKQETRNNFIETLFKDLLPHTTWNLSRLNDAIAEINPTPFKAELLTCEPPHIQNRLSTSNCLHAKGFIGLPRAPPTLDHQTRRTVEP